jgi:2-keto-4-pentenoate hydratase
MLYVFKVIFSGMIIISASHAQELTKNYCQQFSDYVREYNKVFNSAEYFPQPEISSKQEAYLVQACVVSNEAQKIVGFKAGLISKSSQKRFNTDEPVLGVLTQKNLKDLNIIINDSNKTSLIELEFAFRLKRNIENLVELEGEIYELVDAVAPAIELPLFHFENTSNLISNDIVAANVGANIFMLGDFISIENVDIDSIEVSLTRNGEVIGSSVETSAINRGASLKWLIKKSYLEGYDLKKGAIYLTGSLINPGILTKANYYADYNQMGDFMLMVK